MARASTPASGTTVSAVLAWLELRGSKKNRDGMARYAIVSPKVFGVSVGTLRAYAKTLGRDHRLAEALWKSGWYEARMLAAFVDDPAQVTPAQMDRWARGFDNWAVCDHSCFHLFDKTPHAYGKVATWARSNEEFVKRAAFALAASLALHDKQAPDGTFRKFLPLIEKAATDERNFVKKGVSWGLRGIGHRSPALRAGAMTLAARLAASKNASARWVGKDAIRDLSRLPKKKKAKTAAQPA
jgi:3-methyladenine DNA glycosylase AlkD